MAHPYLASSRGNQYCCVSIIMGHRYLASLRENQNLCFHYNGAPLSRFLPLKLKLLCWHVCYLTIFQTFWKTVGKFKNGNSHNCTDIGSNLDRIERDSTGQIEIIMVNAV